MVTDAQPQPAAAPMPKRRWFQYSISSLLVVVSIVGVALGVTARRVERQRKAVAVVKFLGGEVVYVERSRAPERLRRAVGDDWFITVVEVDLSGANLSDAGLEYLEGLPRLQKLWLGGTNVSSDGVAKLQEALPDCAIYCPEVGLYSSNHIGDWAHVHERQVRPRSAVAGR